VSAPGPGAGRWSHPFPTCRVEASKQGRRAGRRVGPCAHLVRVPRRQVAARQLLAPGALVGPGVGRQVEHEAGGVVGRQAVVLLSGGVGRLHHACGAGQQEGRRSDMELGRAVSGVQHRASGPQGVRAGACASAAAAAAAAARRGAHRAAGQAGRSRRAGKMAGTAARTRTPPVWGPCSPRCSSRWRRRWRACRWCSSSGWLCGLPAQGCH
jgi:hypothetical protein